jgi:hypothetical protein
VATGGDGSPHLQSQGSVALTGNGQHLLVTNAASDDLSVFAVAADGLLRLRDRVHTGTAPRSVAERDGLYSPLIRRERFRCRPPDAEREGPRPRQRCGEDVAAIAAAPRRPTAPLRGHRRGSRASRPGLSRLVRQPGPGGPALVRRPDLHPRLHRPVTRATTPLVRHEGLRQSRQSSRIPPPTAYRARQPDRSRHCSAAQSRTGTPVIETRLPQRCLLGHDTARFPKSANRSVATLAAMTATRLDSRYQPLCRPHRCCRAGPGFEPGASELHGNITFARAGLCALAGVGAPVLSSR